MKTRGTEIVRQVLALMDLAEQIGLESPEYRDLMRDIEREAKRRIARDARTYRPSRRR